MGERTTDTSRTVTVGCQFCATLNRVDIGRLDEAPRCGRCGRPILLDRPIKATDDTLPHLVKGAEVPVVVDFYADWCGPCKVMAPVLDDLARERMGRVLVTKLNTDLNPAATARFGIRGIPTLIIFRDGREFLRQTGAVPRKMLHELVDRALAG